MSKSIIYIIRIGSKKIKRIIFFLDNESFICHNKSKEKQKSGFSATLPRKKNKTKRMKNEKH